MEIKQNFLKFTGLTLAIFMSIVALSLCDHLVEKRRYSNYKYDLLQKYIYNSFTSNRLIFR